MSAESSAKATNELKVFVGNLPFDKTKDDVAFLFRENVGEVQGVNIRVDRTTGRSRGFCFVTFTEPENVALAIETMHGYSYEGRPLTVNTADNRGQGGQGSNRGREREAWMTSSSKDAEKGKRWTDWNDLPK